jgi:exodeoxyribonuclease X
MSTALIVDCETTGLVAPVVPVEVAWVSWNMDGTEDAAEPVCVRLNPGSVPITYGAMATHGIAPEDVEHCLPAASFKLPPNDYLIGHNVDYDWSALGKPECRRICTLALARRLWPELDSHSLWACWHYAVLRPGVPRLHSMAHGAATDVIVCRSVLRAMLGTEKVKDYVGDGGLERLWKLSEVARVPNVMPFGKHKGLPIAQVPRDYVAWLLDQPDVDPYLRKALTRTR